MIICRVKFHHVLPEEYTQSRAWCHRRFMDYSQFCAGVFTLSCVNRPIRPLGCSHIFWSALEGVTEEMLKVLRRVRRKIKRMESRTRLCTRAATYESSRCRPLYPCRATPCLVPHTSCLSHDFGKIKECKGAKFNMGALPTSCRDAVPDTPCVATRNRRLLSTLLPVS
jgi:hypothetical protein